MKVLILAFFHFCYGYSISQMQANQFLTQSKNQSKEALFKENRGQVSGDDASQVKYVYQMDGTCIFLRDNGITYQFEKKHYPDGFAQLISSMIVGEKGRFESPPNEVLLETYRIDLVFIGSNPNPKITAEGRSKYYENYYTMNAFDVHQYSKIIYHDIYPNIDWIIYCSDQGVKYDFLVHPGGDPKKIKLKIKWAENSKLDKDGALHLKCKMGVVVEKQPISYQLERKIHTRFLLVDDTLSFEIDNYNNQEVLIIDPLVRVWGTYYGSYNSEAGYDIALDELQNIYLAGITFSHTIIGNGGHQTSYGGGADAFLAKFDSTGTLQWSTYYGGYNYDCGYSCAVDGSGTIYLAGDTKSTSNVASNGFLNTKPGTSSAFLVSFDSSGVRNWATYYGGSHDNYGILYDCATDGNGAVFLTGTTDLTENVAYMGFQNTFYGRDVFLVKFDNAGNRLWGTYYGGYGNDVGKSCATDRYGNVYLSGDTPATENIAFNGHQNIKSGYHDAFLVKFDTHGERIWGTYYGGSAMEYYGTCCTDTFGNVFLVGITYSNDGIAFNAHKETLDGGQDIFIVKFDSSGTRLWGTYYGGEGVYDESVESCVTDFNGNLYVCGSTTSPTNIAYWGHQDTLNSQWDAYLVKFNQNGERVRGTYYGGEDWDHGHSCATDVEGNVYLAGGTNSNTGIYYQGYANIINGAGEAFMVKFIDEGNNVGVETMTPDDTSWMIYPNPAEKVVKIKFNSNETRTVVLSSITGQLLHSVTQKDTIVEIDISGFTKGVYLVHVQEAKTCNSQQFIIK